MRYVIVIVFAVFVSGCVTTDSMTGNRSTVGHELSIIAAERQYQEVLERSSI